MKRPRESAYAIEGLLALANEPMGSVLLLQGIAKSRKVPQSFLAKIFQKVTRAGIVVSSPGRVRGYTLARPARHISVGEILLAVEGRIFLIDAFFGVSAAPTPIPACCTSVARE